MPATRRRSSRGGRSVFRTVDLDQCCTACRIVNLLPRFDAMRGQALRRRCRMSDSLEQLLNLALDGREQRRHQHTVEQAQREPAIRAGRKEFEQRQTKFSTEVRSLMQTAAEQANEHLATRSEGCRVCEVSGYFTGPWFPGGSACNPIAYEVRVKGQVLGEALVLELTQDGM